MKKILALLILACLSAGMGYSFDRAYPIVQYIEVPRTEYVWLPPLTINSTEYIITPPILITKTKYIEVIKEIEVLKEVIKYRQLEYQEWQSVDHFIDWYKSRKLVAIFMVGGRPAVCSDYAQDLQRVALQQGYAVSLALVDYRGCIYGVYIGEANHMGNLIVVNKEVYYVEGIPGFFKMVKITPIW